MGNFLSNIADDATRFLTTIAVVGGIAGITLFLVFGWTSTTAIQSIGAPLAQRAPELITAGAGAVTSVAPVVAGAALLA